MEETEVSSECVICHRAVRKEVGPIYYQSASNSGLKADILGGTHKPVSKPKINKAGLAAWL